MNRKRGAGEAGDDLDLIKQYIDSAKSFVQLSSAALVIPLALKTNLFSAEKAVRFTRPELSLIGLSWLFFLVAIGAGVLYQYVAVKFVEYERSPAETHVPTLLKWIVEDQGPGVIYGPMVIAFYCGAVCVVAYSCLMISR